MKLSIQRGRALLKLLTQRQDKKDVKIALSEVSIKVSQNYHEPGGLQNPAYG